MKAIARFTVCLVLLTISLGAPSALAVNKVLSLDGEGDYVEVPDSPSLDIEEQITLEAWVYCGFPEETDRIVCKTWEGDIDPWMTYGLYRESAPGVVFRITTSEGHRSRLSTGDSGLKPFGWTHIAGVYNGINQIIYISRNARRRKDPSSHCHQ